MDTPNLDGLNEEESKLLAQLADIKKKKEEIRLAEVERAKLAALEVPVTVQVVDFAGGMVITQSAYRDDLTELWRTIPGRAYRGVGQNAIPVGEWNKNVVAKLQSMKNVSIVYNGELETIIDRHLNAPKWFVEIRGNYIRLTPGSGYNTYDVNEIPGIQWDNVKKWFILPLTEAWRLYKQLEHIEGVIYTDEAKEFTIKQIESRSMIDKIGMAKDWEYDVKFQHDLGLRPFQKVGCAFIEATGGRALLAYQMGLGKTFIALAYSIKHSFRTLIVCPASLKSNWCREIYRLSGKKAHVLIGGEPSNMDIVNLITDKNQQFTLINYDLVGRKTVIPPQQTVDANGIVHIKPAHDRYMWADALNMAGFDLVIFDESHYAKNTDSNRTKAVMQLKKIPRVLHMTGTPVLNRPGELWPLLTMLAPETFPSEEAFIKHYTWDGKQARNVDELKEVLRPIMIRRKQSDVVDDMPPLNRIEDYHELSAKARKLYRKVEEGIWEAISEYSNSGQHGGESGITSILAKIQRLKMVCAIDKVESTADLATQLADSASEEKHNKVLIFTQYKAVAFAIAQRLGHEALSFVERGRNDFHTLDDNSRARMVEQFQTDDKIKYLVVTEKTAKEGHNITKAGYVIFNDLFWTPANHEQGEGRAYMRIGDPHGIDSYYRITDMDDNGIEEWIWELLHKKMAIIESTVEGVEAARDTSIAMALIQRMKDSMWTRGKK